MLKLQIFYWKLLGISIKIKIFQCQTRIRVKLINETGFNSYKKRNCKIFFFKCSTWITFLQLTTLSNNPLPSLAPREPSQPLDKPQRVDLEQLTA